MKQFRLVADEEHHIGDPVNRAVKPGEVFTVPDENAEAFSLSPDRFEAVLPVKNKKES